MAVSILQSYDFKKGFAAGLVVAGVAFENKGGSGSFPDAYTLSVVNCDYYRGNVGDGVAYLNADYFSIVLSSNTYYTPDSGIVMIGEFRLMDWDDYTGVRPEAILKIVVDDKIHYEGDIYSYFHVYSSQDLSHMKVFSYSKSFSIQAKRTNLTNGMALELYRTSVISTE